MTTAADIVDPGDGKLSLREAIAKTNATASLDAIEFEPSLEGKTLVLTGGPLVVSHDLVIDGDRNDDGVAVTLSGGGKQRILVTTVPHRSRSPDLEADRRFCARISRRRPLMAAPSSLTAAA